MATQVKLRRNDPSKTNTSAAFVGTQGEVTVDLDIKTLRVHDGATSGGTVLAKKSEVDDLVTSVNQQLEELLDQVQQMIGEQISNVLPEFNGDIDETTGKAFDAGKVLTITDDGELAWVLPAVNNEVAPEPEPAA